MTTNRTQALSSMTSRQKIMGIIFAVIVLVVLWQALSFFKGGTPSTPSPTIAGTGKPNPTLNAGGPNGMPASPQPMTPQPAQLSRNQAPLSPQELALQQMQQATERDYVSALNQLQMLKVQKDIAETNKAIMTAKLDTVTSEKKVVDLLAPPVPVATAATYAQGLEGIDGHKSTTTTSSPQTEANYTVISVSQLQSKWGAVLGYQGSLYNVSLGDVLPDKSIVLHIDKSGVILEKDSVRKKISLVPII